MARRGSRLWRFTSCRDRQAKVVTPLTLDKTPRLPAFDSEPPTIGAQTGRPWAVARCRATLPASHCSPPFRISSPRPARLFPRRVSSPHAFPNPPSLPPHRTSAVPLRPRPAPSFDSALAEEISRAAVHLTVCAALAWNFCARFSSACTPCPGAAASSQIAFSSCHYPDFRDWRS